MFRIHFAQSEYKSRPFGRLLFDARSTRLELATSRVTGGCSNQLSYDRKRIGQRRCLWPDAL
jgi:hypothetical protein